MDRQMTVIECETQLISWAEEFELDTSNLFFDGFIDLGKSVRGRTSYIWNCDKNRIDIFIALNKRLYCKWRIKAILWHEFCHFWVFSSNHYQGHKGEFDKCLRRKKVLWLLGSISRIIPMI